MGKEENQIENSLKLLVKSSFIVFVGVVLSKVFMYLYKVIIAREFGPETYGVFSLALMVVGVFASIASLGLSDGILRYVSIYKRKNELNKAKYMIKLVSWILIPVSILFGIICYATAETVAISIFHNAELVLFIQLLSITIPLSIISSIYVPIIRAFENISAYSFIINIFQNGIRVIFLILLIAIGIGSNSTVYSYIIGSVLLVYVSYLGCKYQIKKIFAAKDIKANVKKEVRTEVFTYSWPIVFLGLIATLYYWIDSFVIGYFGNATDVGLYNAAFTIVTLFGIAPELFMQLFLPMILGHYSKNNFKVIKELSQQVGKWIFILNTPLFLIMVLFPGVFINVLFGKEYLVAETTLRILAIGSFLSSLLVTTGNNLLSMMGKSKVIMYNLAVTSVLNLILNIALVPIYGMAGAALATSIIWVLMNVILIVEIKKYLNIIPIRRKIGSIFLVSAFCCLLLVAARNFVPVNIYTLICLAFASGIIYLVLIFATGCLDKYDWMIIKSIKNKLMGKIKQ